MRTFTLCCLATALLLPLGCGSVPTSSRLTSHRKLKPDPQASANFVKAKDLEKQGKFERARELYELALEKDSENPEYMQRLGVICTRLQRYGEADDYFDRAYKLNRKDASLVADMGYSYYARGDLKEAERLLRDAVHKRPSDKRAVSNLALVVGVRGNTEESLSLLLGIDDKPTALCNLAYIHTQRGEYDLAERRFKEALAIDEKHPDATKGLASLSSQRPQQNVAVADSNSFEQETFKPLEAGRLPKSAPAVQQVSSVVNKDQRSVMTANFVEETSDSVEPGLLDANESPMPRSTRSKVITAKFEDADEFANDDQPERKGSQSHDEFATDDDWSDNPPTTARSRKVVSTKKSSGESSDSDWDTDDATASENTAAPASTGDRLKFRSSGSRLRTRAAFDTDK